MGCPCLCPSRRVAQNHRTSRPSPLVLDIKFLSVQIGQLCSVALSHGRRLPIKPATLPTASPPPVGRRAWHLSLLHPNVQKGQAEPCNTRASRRAQDSGWAHCFRCCPAFHCHISVSYRHPRDVSSKNTPIRGQRLSHSTYIKKILSNNQACASFTLSVTSYRLTG